MIDFYNNELTRFNEKHLGLDSKKRLELMAGFVSTETSKIGWSRGLRQQFSSNKYNKLSVSKIVPSIYRPFTSQWVYFDRPLNEYIYLLPRIFPKNGVENLVIQFNAKYSNNGVPVLISNMLPDLHCNGDSQCFPLYLYDEQAQEQPDDDLFAEQGISGTGLQRRDAITDEGLAHFQEAYPDEDITKEDLFYYVYGILHSEDYRSRFADNLSKELPRIPRVKTAADFWRFSQAGRSLAELHLNFETVDKYPATVKKKGNLTDDDYRVVKMKFSRKKNPETGKNEDDRSTVIYNEKLTVTDIPEEAWDYVVNGKPALAWVMERQAVTTHKASGIVNDANDWAIETMGNPKYPLELLLRVITVSVETMKIVNALPALDI